MAGAGPRVHVCLWSPYATVQGPYGGHPICGLLTPRYHVL